MEEQRRHIEIINGPNIKDKERERVSEWKDKDR